MMVKLNTELVSMMMLLISFAHQKVTTAPLIDDLKWAVSC